MKKKVLVNDKMQKLYEYYLVEEMGKNFREDFIPQLSPKEMLEAGVFGGKYMNDCKNEFPSEWFKNAKLSDKKDAKINFFGINASLSLKEWTEKGRIYPDDPRGRFQWYCRYYMGRRIEDEDNRQIKRRRAIKRHWMAVKNNCYPMDWECRKKQRQALLHRAYDSRKL
ncbi:hypothetical protein K9M48_00735 [Candidatus Gracilibacteria bacterium]|nr:hypothetical protein [Candidatus Gracilibacteria bacterium]